MRRLIAASAVAVASLSPRWSLGPENRVSVPCASLFPDRLLRSYSTRESNEPASAERSTEDSWETAGGSGHVRSMGGGVAVAPGEHKPSLRAVYPPSAVELPESTFLKCIEKEIMDEKLRLDKEEGGPPIPDGWEVHHTPGTSFFYARKLWLPPVDLRTQSASSSSSSNNSKTNGGSVGGNADPRSAERHYLRVQLTTRDPSLDPECDLRGEHFPFSFFVQRVPQEDSDDATAGQSPHPFIVADTEVGDKWVLGLYKNSIEVRCDFVDGELVVDHLVFHGVYDLPVSMEAKGAGSGAATEANGKAVMLNNPFGGYPGPNLDEAEEEVLDGIQSWLAERHIDDQFGEFVGQYSVWIEQAEYEQWLQQLYDYVAA